MTPRGEAAELGGLSLHGWWVQGTGRMLCWVLDAALLPAGAALLGDTGTTIIVSAGFLTGEQKEGTQYTGWHVSLVEMCLLKQHERAFFSDLVSQLFQGGEFCSCCYRLRNGLSVGGMDVEVQPEHCKNLCVSSSIPQCGTSHTERVSCVELCVWRNKIGKRMCSPINEMETGCGRQHFYAAGPKLSSAVRSGEGRAGPSA